MSVCFIPLTPHFYLVKVGFTGVHIIFLIFALKHRLWVPIIYVLSKNMKIVKKIKLKIVIFTAVKYGCILHGNVFVMVIKKHYDDDTQTS